MNRRESREAAFAEQRRILSGEIRHGAEEEAESTKVTVFGGVTASLLFSP